MASISELRQRMGPCKKRLIDLVAQVDEDVKEGRVGSQDVRKLIRRLDYNVGRFEGLKEEIRAKAVDSPTEQERLVLEGEEYENIIAEAGLIRLTLEEVGIEEGRVQESTDVGRNELPQEEEPTSIVAVRNRDPECDTYNVRLEKLPLPNFSGEVSLWPEFWDTFESAVDRNPQLRPVDKLKYLRAHLTKDAERCIAGLLLTNENYQVAVTLLRERFGDKSILIDNYFRELSSIKPATDEIGNLRRTLDGIEIILRSLEALGEDVDHVSLITTIKGKFPRSILMKIEERLAVTGDTSVRNLRKALQETITIHEKVDRSSLARKDDGRYKDRFTTESLTIKEIKCVYCESSHWSDECNTYPTVEARRKKLSGRCFICIRYGHIAKHCPVDRQCFYCHKTKVHHRSLCPFNKNVHEPKREGERSQDGDKNEIRSCLSSTGEKSILQTAILVCENQEFRSTSRAKAIFDCGSQRTYITRSFANRLKLRCRNEENLMVFSFGARSPKNVKTAYVEFGIKMNNGEIMKLVANIVPTILGKGVACPPLKILKAKYPKLSFADDENYVGTQVDILIGNDYYFDFLIPEKIEVDSGLSLINSKVGWILGGRQSEIKERCREAALVTYSTQINDNDKYLTKPDLPLVKQESIDLERLWELDLIGIREDPVVRNDDLAVARFNKSISFRDSRYFVSWPWRSHPPMLKDNYHLALGRLKSLVKRLKFNPAQLVQYDSTIYAQLQKGIIEEVDAQLQTNHIVHYLPHHAVITPQKTTTKLRVVYDASSKPSKNDNSLNDCLLRGRLLLEDLLGILIRFRLRAFAAVSDIERAYLQIGLNDDSKDATRFFWLKDFNKPAKTGNIAVFRFCRVTFGVISSAFLLGSVIGYHLRQVGTPVATLIAKNIYVDNVVLNYDESDEGLMIYRESKNIFQAASMNLRQWTTNSSFLRENLIPQDAVNDSLVKVLGVVWNVDSDVISIGKGDVENITPCTKRNILRFISRAFDPLGLLSPVTLLGKLFIKKLWTLKLGWDEDLDFDTQKEWLIILGKIKGWDKLQIRRYLGFRKEATACELHCFSDASNNAYAAVVYIRFTYLKLPTVVSLVIAKSRVSPARANISIPRLELLGAIIGVRLLKFVKENIGIVIDKSYLWTDSKCVLGWLTTNKQLTLFVERRISELRSYDNISFRYVPGSENPSDIASRGTSSSELAKMCLWWEGPSWMKEPEDRWPDVVIDSSEEVGFIENICLSQAEVNLKSDNITPFRIDEVKFSSVVELWKITDRFINENNQDALTLSNDYSESKTLWESYIQHKVYGDVINDMEKGKFNVLVKQLGLWFDDKVLLRCKGRMIYSELMDSSKFPKLLPRNEHYTELIVKYCHDKVMHMGTSQTLAEVRKEYWIPSGRAYIFKVIRKCGTCRQSEGGPYQSPNVAPLPKFRVNRSIPFENTGMDLFGPFFIKNFSDSISKTWACLFTCLVTRAVHLEIMGDMTAPEFALAFRRFVARRCFPKLVISDNAGQFKVGEVLFKKIWTTFMSHPETVSIMKTNGVSWKFIPECSPWMGGVYERLIGLTKRCLRKVLGKGQLTILQLSTVLAEVEAVLNSRPLVYVTSDGLGDEILTPGHFLSLHYQEVQNVLDEPIRKKKIIEAWNKGRKLLDLFWDIWREQYLTSLRERWNLEKKRRPSEIRIPKINDIVQIKDKGPRLTWKVGKISNLNRSEDEAIRSAQVTTKAGHVLTRPLSHLYPLECEIEEAKKKQKPNTDVV